MTAENGPSDTEKIPAMLDEMARTLREGPQSNDTFVRMATELERAAALVRQPPGTNSEFADRLELLAKQIREDNRKQDDGSGS